MKIERAIDILDHEIENDEEIDRACQMGSDALERLIPTDPDNKIKSKKAEVLSSLDP